MIKPFIRWAGGKRSLVETLEEKLPADVKESKVIDTYIEPFIGGGSFFLYLQSNYTVKTAYIADLNDDVANVWKVVQKAPLELIDHLVELQYLFNRAEDKKGFYNKLKDTYNKGMDKDYSEVNPESVKRAATFVTINKLCFNGLYRMNKNGTLNTPYGSNGDKCKRLCDSSNIRAVSALLQSTEIVHADFSELAQYVKKGAIVYLDPPYRALSKTACFNSYAGNFDDNEQKRLAEYCKLIDSNGGHFIQSNSDPKNTVPDDNFFDDLYSDYSIERVKMKRYINSKSDKRGACI